ncbi:unnamed protein product [marine sediment metagenome]|uniref:Uncharacterized protein n=1 Tax=marine sediment metagenome TaxID=412755 RepID=X1QU31_9ZZZZ
MCVQIDQSIAISSHADGGKGVPDVYEFQREPAKRLLGTLERVLASIPLDKAKLESTICGLLKFS